MGRIPWSNPSCTHFRVEMGRSKGLIQGNRWTKSDLPSRGVSGVLEGDLSTDYRFRVDLSPGRDASLWITPVDNKDMQVGPAERRA